MRRIVALIVCIFLFALPVHAANAAVSVSTTAVVGENSACLVTIEAEIRLDDPAIGLKFPLGKDIDSVTLNGTPAPLTQTGGITSVSLSHLDGKMGSHTCTISYSVNSVVTVDEDGKQIVTVPLLYGFPYPVEQMSFKVTMPGEFKTVPAFYSGYHGQDIERQMTTSVNGTVIAGQVDQELKDSETLFMTLTAPKGMFPASQTFGGSLGFDAAAMGVCAALATVLWLMTMRVLPRISPRRPTVPEGICAGQLCSYLVRKPADLPAMVLQWAQLGYLIIHLDGNGRVFLHKKMDMGNERSSFELRCFRDLFGRKQMMDVSSFRFQKVCEKCAGMSRRATNGYRFPMGSARLFRLISCLLGFFAGIAMGDTISTDHNWRLVIMGALGAGGFLLCWLIQDGMNCLHLRSKASLKLSLVAAAVLMAAGALCRCTGYALGAVAWNLLAGLMAAYGGRRTENGARIRGEILGLRRHIRKADAAQLRRILASNRNYYFELAPYALVMGVDKQLAQKMGDARLPACTWLVTGIDSRTAPEWYLQLRDVYRAMHRDRKPTLAERIFGK